MNTDQIKGKWQQIKGDLQKTWGKITDDEWEKTKGETSAVTELVQNKYGQAKEKVSSKVSELYDKNMSTAHQDDQGDDHRDHPGADVESTQDPSTFLKKPNEKSNLEKNKPSEF